MSRLGTNMNISSDNLEAKMLPDVDEEHSKPEEGGEVDLLGDGVHKIYMHRGQLDIWNFGSKNTYIRAARGFGKTALMGIDTLMCALGLPLLIGLFLAASAKQMMCRTMPNLLKMFDILGFPEGIFYFRGQAPAKLRWEQPLAKIRNWENCVHFQNGAVMMGASMAVKGSCNGVNAAWLRGDETKYMPWTRVKEEAFPTVRGDFLPKSLRKVEQRRWGYGTDPAVNNRYCSKMFVSDAGLTQKQCEWEKEEMYETTDINNQIAEMLAELKYLEQVNPRMAVELAQNDNFLRQLHLLRSQSETFWNFSSLENAAMLGGEAWIREMKRSLPDLMFRIQILGQKKGVAKDGFYANFDSSIHTYDADDFSALKTSTYDLMADKFTVKKKGKALDSTKWMQEVETEQMDLDQCQAAGETCALDVDWDPNEPLRIAIDAGANLNCMVVSQLRNVGNGKPALLILKTFYTMNQQKLRSLCRLFNQYYAPAKHRGCGEVIFYWTASVKQGGATAYAVEDSDDSRFDRVVVNELKEMGWKINGDDGYIGAPWRQERKYQFINDTLSGQGGAPFFLYINKEANRNEYLICAIENAAIVPGTFRKDKSHEKLKATDPDSMGGDPRTRTDVTDALDDLIIGVKVCGDGRRRIGGGLKGRFSHLAGIPH